jgi:Swt1-like HEPN
VYRSGDLSLMMRAMTERLGDIGYPFGGQLSRQAQNYASELREFRNRWAHNEKFTAAGPSPSRIRRQPRWTRWLSKSHLLNIRFSCIRDLRFARSRVVATRDVVACK